VAGSQSERRLAAIMFTDIVGYTALMARSEEAGLRARRRHREVVRRQVEYYGGTWIDETGDESLSSFQSATDAVNCALAVNAELRESTELSLRIGIHLGDVLFEGGRVYGDGVNVASRIRASAEPGAVNISEAVQHSIRNQPNVETHSLGEHALKNVPQPLELFAASGRAAPLQPHVAEPRRRRGLLARLRSLRRSLRRRGRDGRSPDRGKAHTSSTTVGAGRPVVAVLQLANHSGRPERDGDALSIGEDITACLAQFQAFAVVASRRSEDPAGVAHELGADFVVSGSVRQGAVGPTVRAQLADTQARVLWSDEVALGERSSAEVARALAVRCTPAISEAFAEHTRDTTDPGAWPLVIQAESELLFHPVDPARRHKILELCSRALEQSPDLSLALSLRCAVRMSALALGHGQEDDLQLSDRDSARALELDPLGPSALYFRSVYFAYSGDPESAVRLLERAIEVHPAYAQAHAQLAYQLGRLRRPEEAVGHMDRAHELSPRDPRAYLWRYWEAIAHTAGRDWDRAIDACEASIAVHRPFVPTWLTYVAVLAAKGRAEDARGAAAQLRSIDPALDEARIRNMLRLGFASNPRFIEGLVGIYRQVGLIAPEAEPV
jgi:adenylate cyclase